MERTGARAVEVVVEAAVGHEVHVAARGHVARRCAGASRGGSAGSWASGSRPGARPCRRASRTAARSGDRGRASRTRGSSARSTGSAPHVAIRSSEWPRLSIAQPTPRAKLTNRIRRLRPIHGALCSPELPACGSNPSGRKALVVGPLDLDRLPRRGVVGVIGEQPDLVDEPALDQLVQSQPVVQAQLVQRPVVEADRRRRRAGSGRSCDRRAPRGSVRSTMSTTR